MGIEPTSEAWEACCRYTKADKLAAFSRFSEVLKWIPIGAAGDNPSVNSCGAQISYQVR